MSNGAVRHLLAVWVVLSCSDAMADRSAAAEHARAIRQTRTWRAAADVVRLRALTPDLPHDVALGYAKSLAGLRRLDPDVRALVVDWWAELLFSAGKTKAARARLEKDGVLLTGWWILGPVPADEIAATDPFEPDRPVPARPEPVRWRDVSRAWPLGRLPLDRLTSSEDDTVAALATRRIRVDKARKVRITSRPGERARFALNGRTLPESGLATLEPGWNRVTVHTRPPESGPWTLTVRVTSAPRTAPPPLLTRWRNVEDDPGSRARVLAAFGEDVSTAVADVLAVQAPTGSDATILAWRDGATVARRSDLALRLWRRILRHRPADASARVELGRRYYDRGQALTALDEVRKGLAMAPTHLAGRRLEAEILADLQAAGAAQGRLLELLADQPGVPSVLAGLASVYQRRQLPERALERFTELAAIDDGLGDVSFQRFELLRGLGRASEAAATLEALVARRPDVPGYRVSLVRLREDLGDDDGAKSALTRALADFGRSAELAREGGAFHLRAGRRADGLGLLRRSLFLRPHQPTLRARVERLQRAEGSYEHAVMVDARHAIRTAPTPSDAPAEYLLSQRVARVFDDGTTATRVQHVLRVNRVPSGDRERAWSVLYDPSRQSVAVLAARRFRNGRLLDHAEQSDAAVSESWYGLYYEQRATTLTFRDLEPGDVLLVDHRLSDFGASLYGRTFSDLVGLQDREPRHRYRLTWIAPKDLPLVARLPGSAEEAAPETSTQDDRTTIGWDLRDLPGVELEAAMPGYTEVSAHAHVTTFTSWQQVAAWYRELTRTQLEVNDRIAARARTLTAHATTVADKVDALHAFVAQKIRYVGLEFGEHGYKPYAVADVLERRFGDCKDKASLLKAMLGVVGVDSELVLVRTRPQGRVSEVAVSPAIFDHAILYVPAVDRYLDATATFNGPDELPPGNQGASALVVGATMGRFVQLPTAPATANALSRTYTLTPGPDGTAIQGRIEATGAFAGPLRELLAPSTGRTEQFELMLVAEYPGFEMADAAFEQVTDIARPVVLGFSGRLPAPTDAIRLLQPGMSLARIAEAPKRRHDLLLEHPFVWRWRIELQPGEVKLDLPEPGEVSTSFGGVRLRVGKRRIELEVRLEAHRVAVADYPAFRSFVRLADTVFQSAARLQVIDAK